MKRTPIPSVIPSINWDSKTDTTLFASICNLYSGIVSAKEPETEGRSKAEAQYLLENAIEEQALTTGSLSDQELTAQYLSLWTENAKVSQISQEMGEAGVEIEMKNNFLKDCTVVEIHRRGLVKNITEQN